MAHLRHGFEAGVGRRLQPLHRRPGRPGHHQPSADGGRAHQVGQPGELRAVSGLAQLERDPGPLSDLGGTAHPGPAGGRIARTARPIDHLLCQLSGRAGHVSGSRREGSNPQLRRRLHAPGLPNGFWQHGSPAGRRRRTDGPDRARRTGAARRPGPSPAGPPDPRGIRAHHGRHRDLRGSSGHPGGTRRPPRPRRSRRADPAGRTRLDGCLRPHPGALGPAGPAATRNAAASGAPGARRPDAPAINPRPVRRSRSLGRPG